MENQVKSYYVEMVSGMEAIVQAEGPKKAKDFAEEKFGEECCKCREIKVSKKRRVWEIIQEPLGEDEEMPESQDVGPEPITWDAIAGFLAEKIGSIFSK